MSERPPVRSNRGFTLVEVMVALLIVALTVPALLFTLDQHVDGAAYLRDRSLAQTVASNKLTELRLVAAALGQRLTGSESGVAVQAERDFFWWVENTDTEVPDFYRVTVRVGLKEGDPDAALVTETAFMAAPLSELPGE